MRTYEDSEGKKQSALSLVQRKFCHLLRDLVSISRHTASSLTVAVGFDGVNMR